MPLHDHDWNSGSGWVVMLVFMLLFIAITVVAIVLAVQAIQRSSSTRSSPEQLLAERFARGEIDAEEYQRRSTMLRAARG